MSLEVQLAMSYIRKYICLIIFLLKAVYEYKKTSEMYALSEHIHKHK